MSKDIKPELFEIKTDLGDEYVVAYDHVHALQCVAHCYKGIDIKSISQLTGKFGNHLTVAKECLPQGLVNKTTND
tara:strand:- start:591 stop:815 length:225 start_codon:yes stop_codon:yes gene_type:complete